MEVVDDETFTFLPSKSTNPIEVLPIPVPGKNVCCRILISKSTLKRSVGENWSAKFPFSSWVPTISTNLDSTSIDPFWIVTISELIKSIDVNNSVVWRTLSVVPVISSALAWIKNLSNELVRSNLPLVSTLLLASLNNSVILSIIKTLFVEHSKKLERRLFSKVINFDLSGFDKTSTSWAKSKVSIASTLFSEVKSLIIVDESTDTSVPTPTEEVIPTSAKFLSPVVWTNLFTGLTIFWYSIGLWIV